MHSKHQTVNLFRRESASSRWAIPIIMPVIYNWDLYATRLTHCREDFPPNFSPRVKIERLAVYPERVFSWLRIRDGERRSCRFAGEYSQPFPIIFLYKSDLNFKIAKLISTDSLPDLIQDVYGTKQWFD